jgi:hypothetical protein
MKRKLSSNGQQFHQYQSPVTEHKKKGGTPSDVGNGSDILVDNISHNMKDRVTPTIYLMYHSYKQGEKIK